MCYGKDFRFFDNFILPLRYLDICCYWVFSLAVGAVYVGGR